MDLTEGCVLQYPIEKCPANFVSLVGSKVEVLTINHSKFVGQIYSMDPISGSLFMMIDRCSQEERSIKLIIGSSIKFLKIVKLTNTPSRSQSTDENPLQTANTNSHLTEDWKQIKEPLKRWFHESRIPVSENSYGCLLVLNEIVIEPPYRPENCSGTNEVMLWRVQKLLENFYQQ